MNYLWALFALKVSMENVEWFLEGKFLESALKAPFSNCFCRFLKGNLIWQPCRYCEVHSSFIHSHELWNGVSKQEAIKLGIIIVGTNPFIFVFVLKVFVLHVKNVCCFYLAHFVILWFAVVHIKGVDKLQNNSVYAR